MTVQEFIDYLNAEMAAGRLEPDNTLLMLCDDGDIDDVKGVFPYKMMSGEIFGYVVHPFVNIDEEPKDENGNPILECGGEFDDEDEE